jgi:uncharacterized protein YjiS (DUF1127 family)
LHRELPRSAVNEHAAALNKRWCRRSRIAAKQHLEVKMSATLSTIVRLAGTKTHGAFLRTFNACWQRIARYCVRRAAIISLRELDDEALRDMGIARSQIEAAAYGLVTNPKGARR